MRRSLFLPVLFLALAAPDAIAQDDLLQSGPMLGYSEMFEVLVWAQTTTPADMKVVYWDLESPDARMETETVATTKAAGYTAKMIADQ
ncbi:MAG: alkaline phosphatase family protein, partial [Gemmatimonadetes bacterium]|nr:alkaline phosphatase family protein [Gemmatimonadota bacterium]